MIKKDTNALLRIIKECKTKRKTRSKRHQSTTHRHKGKKCKVMMNMESKGNTAVSPQSLADEWKMENDDEYEMSWNPSSSSIRCHGLDKKNKNIKVSRNTKEYEKSKDNCQLCVLCPMTVMEKEVTCRLMWVVKGHQPPSVWLGYPTRQPQTNIPHKPRFRNIHKKTGGREEISKQEKIDHVESSSSSSSFPSSSSSSSSSFTSSSSSFPSSFFSFSSFSLSSFPLSLTPSSSSCSSALVVIDIINYRRD